MVGGSRSDYGSEKKKRFWISFYKDYLNHGTIIRTGIIYTKKSLVICATQLAGGLLLKKLC